ncbi:MAG TPA: hypothetical protein VEZ14_14010 [Dehalococcoidia bacterium]|nr:hypothetical protein [Dehalococcoidia bacterium]
MTLRGALTLDGAPLNADFLGARVIRNGLAAACQDKIPAVRDGRFEITVAADAEVRGCGAPGSEILLWAYAAGRFHFSMGSIPWPGDGAQATFDAAFSSATPAGASEPVTEFKGHLLDTAGRSLPAGTVVEAYIGDVLCGVTSLRYGGATEGYVTMIVAGPSSVPACAAGATVTFRLASRPATQTITNAPGTTLPHDLDLTLAP